MKEIFMRKNKFTSINIISAVLLSLLLLGCSKNTDPSTGKIKRYEPNVTKKMQAADKGIFFDRGNSSKNNTFDFATSNVMWRATLDAISFMPLSNASYSGGIITTDWYSSKDNKEMIKLNIRFLSDQLESSSIVVSGFKRSCSDIINCVTKPTDQSINQSIKLKILNKARELSLQDAAKKKK